jgi:hypothetical protein
MQTRYKIVVGSVCGFPKFVTSGSGLGSGFSKIQFWVWVWVLVQGSKISQKPGFGFRFGLGFVKNIKIPAKFPQKNYFSYILRRCKLVFVENNRKN